MNSYETFESDVLIVGAGGAGLRATVAAREAGCSVNLVCKSLLGKAHTVMAEGGVAAALGNMGEPDNWKVHFMDTMKGGQFLNNPRTVEIFAKEAPERVLELEQYGAVFDRTPQGLISQRPFGGHTYRRLNHVGDRTGLELIRTMQDKAVIVRHECPHGSDAHPTAQRRRPGHRRVRLFPRDGPLCRFQGQIRRAGNRRLGADVQSHVQLLGVHRRRPDDGL